MSRLLRRDQIPGPSRPASFADAAPFSHRPTLLSPPETDPMQDSTYEDSHSPPEHLAHETPVSRIRRPPGMPNVGYTNGGSSIREKSSLRQSKWLIIVCPPKSFNKEPPTLGHTLSSAPAGRFSNGILMPLFSSLYAQLTAIAREFNMPSITGLCLYLQLQEGVSSMLTPRISDEVWHSLWASYFTDDEPPRIPSHGLPVIGRVEFDIDLRRAKWYNAWMGFTLKDPEGISREPSIVPSHWRGESRTSFLQGENNLDDHQSPPRDSHNNSVRRQVPRPLLLEKRENLHQRSSSRTSIRNIFQDAPEHDGHLPDISATTHQIFVPNALSPMVQELEEPQSSTSVHLKTFVQKWRDNSIVASSPPSTGQPSLNPVNLPPGLDADLKLDLKDFTWSISSAGPPSQSPASPGWPERLPSIHLADRMQGSRCNTPTTCTSWGPPTEEEGFFDFQSYRLPSPDMGYRILDCVPLTPSTCTTWGPNDLPSPIFSQPSARALSIDVAVRAVGSAPVTPSTCTTWGPDDLPSPVSSHYSFGNVSVDLGMRQRGSTPVSPTIPSAARIDTETSTVPTSTCAPFHTKGDHVDSCSADHNSLWLNVWPYNDPSSLKSTSVTWSHVWPYVWGSDSNNVLTSYSVTKAMQLSLEHYPDLEALYSKVERCTVPDDGQAPQTRLTSYPFLEIYSPVYPHNLTELYGNVLEASFSYTNEMETSHGVISLTYPFFDLYPAVYPYNLERIYPVTITSSELPLSETRKPSEYPFFDIYPSIDSGTGLKEIYGPLDKSISLLVVDSVSEESKAKVLYPYFDVYPPSSDLMVDLHSPSNGGEIEILDNRYPSLNIYPAVYPFNLTSIYPSVDLRDETVQSHPLATIVEVSKVSQYPSFCLYPGVYPFNLIDIYPPTESLTIGDFDAASMSNDSSVLLKMQYPSLDIYPAVYPYSMTTIYPEVSPRGIIENVKTIFPPQNRTTPSTGRGYPSLDIYPLVYPLDMSYTPRMTTLDLGSPGYPQIELYGTVYGQVGENNSFDTASLAEKSDLYSIEIAGYPFIDVYSQPSAKSLLGTESLSVSLTVSYPLFELYPPVYPFNLERIYPSISLVQPTKSQDMVEQTINYGVYPNLIIYLSGYPWSLNHIYQADSECYFTNLSVADRSIMQNNISLSPVVMKHSEGYPTFSLYPPSGYPNIVLYPPVWDWIATQEGGEKLALTQTAYPVFDIYPALYPFIRVYPTIISMTDLPEFPVQPSEHRIMEVGHRYPFIEIYPSVYPHFDLYPNLQPEYQNAALRSIEPGDSRLSKKRLSGHTRSGSGHSSPPPIPTKPPTLKGAISRSNSLKVVKRRRTHHELYMAIIDDVQRVLEERAISEANSHHFEEKGLEASRKSHLLRTPSTPVRSTSLVTEKREFAHPVGLPYSPSQMRVGFAGHVSTSIHSRVQSMHSQSLSKSKDETDKSGLERSKSLSDRTKTTVLDRAKLFSATHEKSPPPIPNKPLSKFGRPRPSNT